MFNFCFRLLTLFLALACLPACAAFVAMIGYSNSAVQVAVHLDRAKLMSDGVSYLGSGKTITDHAVSMVARADCRVLNIVSPDPLCTPISATTLQWRATGALTSPRCATNC